MGGKFKNFHEKENRLALIREMIFECFNFLLVSNFRKRKKKKHQCPRKHRDFEKKLPVSASIDFIPPVREPNIRRKLLKEPVSQLDA